MKNNDTPYIYAGHADQPYGPRKFIPDTPEERQKAIDEGYTAGSITSFTVMLAEYYSQPALIHRLSLGPLFIEFEAKRSPGEAIRIARNFVITRLVNLCAVDPGCLRYSMNGSKGCYIEIPADIYGAEKGNRYLSLIQRDMLLHLGLGDFYDYTKICPFQESFRYFMMDRLIPWANISKRQIRRYIA